MPSAAQAARSSPTRYPPSWSACPTARPRSDSGMTSPSSPRVQVTSVTWTPAAAYRAIVPPVHRLSSSGCACTSSSRGGALNVTGRAYWEEGRRSDEPDPGIEVGTEHVDQRDQDD